MLGSRFRADGTSVLVLNDVQEAARRRVLDKLDDGTYSTEDAPCLLCGSAAYELLSQKDRYGLPMVVVVCRRCGLVQTSPRLTEASYARFYDSDYRPLYVGAEHPPASFFDRQVRHGHRILRWLARQDLLPSPGGTVAEVGCGAGGNLVAFREAGFEVTGVDLGSEYVAFGSSRHGLPLRVGTATDLPASVDLVLYSHVFEHLADPEADLDQLAPRLGADGVLYIELPGIKRLSAYDGDFLRYLQNAHVTHFSAATLSGLLGQHGWQVIAGDEVIRAACRFAGDAQPPAPNDYRSVTRYLARAERLLPARRLAPPAFDAVRKLQMAHDEGGIGRAVRRRLSRTPRLA